MVHYHTDRPQGSGPWPRQSGRIISLSQARTDRYWASQRSMPPIGMDRMGRRPADGQPVAPHARLALPTPLQQAGASVLGQPWARMRTVHRPLLKRTMDILGSAVGLALLSPLLIGIAAAIKLNSPGPVIFRQARYGRGGELFYTLKFRTMHVACQDASGIAQTRRNDPRITPVGRFLRQSNFDELPQLWNVLKGDMSLVGPRPHVPGMLAAGVPYEEFDSRYMDRHQVRPGITGLAQVNGFRGETTEEYHARMRVHHDLEYVRNQSTRGDMKILFQTVWTEFIKGTGY